MQKPPRRGLRRFRNYHWLRGHATNDTCDWSNAKSPSLLLNITHYCLIGNPSSKTSHLPFTEHPVAHPDLSLIQTMAGSIEEFCLGDGERDAVKRELLRLELIAVALSMTLDYIDICSRTLMVRSFPWINDLTTIQINTGSQGSPAMSQWLRLQLPDFQSRRLWA